MAAHCECVRVAARHGARRWFLLSTGSPRCVLWHVSHSSVALARYLNAHCALAHSARISAAAHWFVAAPRGISARRNRKHDAPAPGSLRPPHTGDPRMPPIADGRGVRIARTAGWPGRLPAACSVACLRALIARSGGRAVCAGVGAHRCVYLKLCFYAQSHSLLRHSCLRSGEVWSTLL